MDYPKEGKPKRVLPIRSQSSLDKAIKDADSDEDLASIKNRLGKRGYSTEGLD